MDTPHEYSKDGMQEGDPGNINPNEIGRNNPAKNISATEKLDINESELGRDQSHRAAEEIIDDNISQIDEGTKNMREEEISESMKETMRKEFDTEDFKRVDERDNGDSTKDWDAERSRTGRQK